GAAADRDRGVLERVGAVADRGTLPARGDRGEAFEFAGVAVVDVRVAAQRGGAVASGLAAGAVGGGVGGAGDAAQARGGGVPGERVGAAAERRRAVTDRTGGLARCGGVVALDPGADAVVVGVGAGLEEVVGVVRGL